MLNTLEHQVSSPCSPIASLESFSSGCSLMYFLNLEANVFPTHQILSPILVKY